MRNITDGFVYGEGIQRTDLDCTSCGKVFVAKLNFDLDGNHKILCPYCGHEHWRVIKKGVVTGSRWGSQNGPNVPVSTERKWTDQTNYELKTTSVGKYIRDKWINEGRNE